MPRAPRPPRRKKPTADRRAAILDAALTEFARHGFAGTSTNAIAARARVAKGLVFHHFGSKEALYLTVVEEVAGEFGRRLAGYLDVAPVDLFERIFGWSQLKLEMVLEDPRRIRVLVDALADAPEAIRTQVRSRSESISRPRVDALFGSVDTSRLRPGVTPQEAIGAAMLLAGGFERLLLPAMSARADKGTGILDKTLAESRRMFELLRDGIYRQER